MVHLHHRGPSRPRAAIGDVHLWWHHPVRADNRRVSCDSEPMTEAAVGLVRRAGAQRSISDVCRWLPHDANLPPAVWNRRHGMLRVLLVVMLTITLPYGWSKGLAGEAVAWSIPSYALLAVSMLTASMRHVAAALQTLALFYAAALLVALSGGVTEAHFMFFVLVAAIALYQDWRVLLVGVAFVLGHHAMLGLLRPELVFASHHETTQHASFDATSLELTLVHGGFLLAAIVASIMTWKATEAEAFCDALTELPNRRALAAHLDGSLSASDRGHVALLCLDMCGFKKVNDLYGHDAGDRLLREVARRLRAVIGRGDVLARTGGDEFAVVMHAASVEHAELMAREIIETLADRFVVDGRQLSLGVSVGLMMSPSDRHLSSNEMLRHAELALYAAKARFGDRGGYSVYSPSLGRFARDTLQLELDLAECLENSELRVLYQPIVDLVTRQIVGTEALVRWNHPQLGLLSPACFVEVAERTGHIVPIGRHILRTAVRQLAAWNATLPTDRQLTVHVNVSSRQLDDDAFVTDVWGILTAAGVHPANLVLEITEQAIVGSTASLEALHALRQLGVRLALDDFGTGYSSLSYLARMPVDEIKIDKSFTDDVPGGRNAALLGGVLALAGQMGLRTVIEGIEQPTQIGALLGLGARVGQGYLFDQPLTPDAFKERLRVADFERQMQMHHSRE